MKKLKTIFLIFSGLILTYFGAKTFRSFSVVDESQELKTDHFVIIYQGIYKEKHKTLLTTWKSIMIEFELI